MIKRGFLNRLRENYSKLEESKLPVTVNECSTVDEIRKLQKEKEYLESEMKRLKIRTSEILVPIRALCDSKQGYLKPIYGHYLSIYEMLEREIVGNPAYAVEMLEKTIENIGVMQEKTLKYNKYNDRINEINREILQKKEYLGII